MIDVKYYTDIEITHFISIGELELHKVRKDEIKTIEKLFKPNLFML
ncbi:hypothetical protein KJB58_08650 [Staphylococcus hyicus]|uniref:Uncharacterized protein n=1 Tax=Staphylococcus hyicus TaxID=1284 RepID=A0ACD5FMW0_STAHY|nr:hypothetical protein [Staphylococcus hyicus]AJC95872.1 hypothetical protein SHYC_05650 [Staphylococcus hyicus]MCE5154528.1 hypothetical protein [Staphylococcus hyicus]MCQ9291116.1 hypothetical protein [Staphylococcus hyicus]MCQ9306357.1 hypothetical protein [Staphylococcus hyicus]MCQ9308770.1 hypothetical protein [Staphylococcus hyicus]